MDQGHSLSPAFEKSSDRRAHLIAALTTDQRRRFEVMQQDIQQRLAQEQQAYAARLPQLLVEEKRRQLLEHPAPEYKLLNFAVTRRERERRAEKKAAYIVKTAQAMNKDMRRREAQEDLDAYLRHAELERQEEARRQAQTGTLVRGFETARQQDAARPAAPPPPAPLREKGLGAAAWRVRQVAALTPEQRTQYQAFLRAGQEMLAARDRAYAARQEALIAKEAQRIVLLGFDKREARREAEQARQEVARQRVAERLNARLARAAALEEARQDAFLQEAAQARWRAEQEAALPPAKRPPYEQLCRAGQEALDAQARAFALRKGALIEEEKQRIMPPVLAIPSVRRGRGDSEQIQDLWRLAERGAELHAVDRVEARQAALREETQRTEQARRDAYLRDAAQERRQHAAAVSTEAWRRQQEQALTPEQQQTYQAMKRDGEHEIQLQALYKTHRDGLIAMEKMEIEEALSEALGASAHQLQAADPQLWRRIEALMEREAAGRVDHAHAGRDPETLARQEQQRQDAFLVQAAEARAQQQTAAPRSAARQRTMPSSAPLPRWRRSGERNTPTRTRGGSCSHHKPEERSVWNPRNNTSLEAKAMAKRC